MVTQMKKLLDHLQVQIRVAQDQQEVSTNKSRSSAPNFHSSDIVFCQLSIYEPLETPGNWTGRSLAPLPLSESLVLMPMNSTSHTT
jgi:hypothetical protein